MATTETTSLLAMPLVETAPSPKQFINFPLLPKELRDQIWQEALLKPEKRTRVVVLYVGFSGHGKGKHVMPCKHLISPLLVVNNESRKHALKFYHVKLPVYRVGQVDLRHIQVEDPDLGDFKAYKRNILHIHDDDWFEYQESKMQRLHSTSFNNYNSKDYPGDEYDDDFVKKHYKDYVHTELRDIVFDPIYAMIANKDAINKQKGILYLNPEHDVFFCGYDPGLHFCVDAMVSILEEHSPVPDPANLKWHHVSAELSADVCQKIAKLVRVTEPEPTRTEREEDDNAPDDVRPREEKVATSFNKEEADVFWDAKTYTNLQSYGRLNLDNNNRRYFMHRITQLRQPGLNYQYKIDVFRWA